MTIASAVSKVTLNGNGSTTSFPFGFKVWKAADLEVSITDASGVVSVVTNWGVALNPTGGGTVAYPTSGPPLPTGHKITIARSMDFLQDVDLVSGTRWDPEVVETALDRATAERQQLKERLDRAVAVPISSSTTPEQFADELFTARDDAAASASAAAASAATAQVAANSVGVLSASGTLTAGQDTITLPWSYGTITGNIAVFLGGVKQLRSTLTFLTPTTVQIGAAVTENTPYEVTSVTLSAESVLTGIRDQCVTAKTGAEAARTGAETARTGAEAARDAAQAAQAATEALVPSSTPPQFDDDLSIATTEFVQRAIGNARGLNAFSASVTLTLADIGKIVAFYGSSSSQVLTLPPANTVAAGAGYWLINQGTVPVQMACSGSDTLNVNTLSGVISSSAITTLSGDSIYISSNGAGTWNIFGWSSNNQFPRLLTSNGYQKIPGGFIIQWGTTGSIATDASTTVTFPVAFPNACLCAVAQGTVAPGTTAGAVITTRSYTQTTMLVGNDGAASTATWFAIGY